MNKKSEKEQKTQNASLKQADSFSQGLRAKVEVGVRGCDGCKAWALPSFSPSSKTLVQELIQEEGLFRSPRLAFLSAF